MRTSLHPLLGGLALLLCTLGATPLAAEEAQEPVVSWKRPYRLIDALGTFYDPEQTSPRSWAMPFGHIDRERAPYVNVGHLERALERFEAYCKLVKRRGYNAVFLGNLIHLASFHDLEPKVYSETSPFLVRAKAYQGVFRRAARIARAQGLTLVLETDFPAWTPPLRKWLGGIKLRNERLWKAWRSMCNEAFSLGVGAISVRIGEGGGAYNEKSGYQSGVIVRSVEDTREALGKLLKPIESYNAKHGQARKLLFRTWTIGIGEIGALHTNPELYQRVFKPFYQRTALVTVIKHVAMDFFCHVPLNPTIGTGDLEQIVEFQARREYEGFGMFPTYRAAPFREALRVFRAKPSFAGISVWPTNGGFLFQAPLLYGVTGPDHWIDANVHAYGALTQNPQLTPREVGAAWAREKGAAPADAQKIAQILLQAQEALERGLYIRAYAERAPAIFGLDHFPTMLWHYWTRTVAALSVQALIAHYSLDDLEQSLVDGTRAEAELERLVGEAEALGESELRDELVASLRYQRSFFEVLSAYRQVFLQHHRWARSGDSSAYGAWRTALPKLREAMRSHRSDFGEDPLRPAMDLRELDRELQDAQRFPAARGLACFLGLLCLLWPGLLVRAHLRERYAEAWTLGIGLALLAITGTVTWALGDHGGLPGGLAALSILGPWLSGSLAFRLARFRGPHDPHQERFWCAEAWARAALWALVPAAPLALLGAALLFTFALRGPVPLHTLAIGAVLSGTTRAALIVALVLIALLKASLTVFAARAHAEGWKRALGALALQGALVALFGLVGAKSVGIQGALELNRAFRLAPTILGEAGTGVEDLVGAEGH